ncbi:MAG: glycosyltransferase family 2 protein [Polyangiales bacterium]|nr:glycosyltransferase family 2 protein [Myxococcales bacterium]MCB9662302.1 glycosyltransferase family 2 protein [Sandaracinaceae bacterium]
MSAGSDTFRPCVIIPSYNNPQTIGRVVSAVRAYVPDVIVVDDGSGLEGRAAIAEVGASGLATVHHRAANGGKGAAVKDALRLARDAGFTHALQVDADGQHTLDDIPAMLEAARETPTALVLGQPVFDDTAPKARLVGRRITIFWTRLEVGGGAIADPMCGFRVYPLPISAEVPVWGDRMDFDPEIAVRLVWAGVPTRNVPTRVRYVSADEGGVSHFHAFKDNVLISLMHSRLMTMRIMGFLFGWLFRGARGRLPS